MRRVTCILLAMMTGCGVKDLGRDKSTAERRAFTGSSADVYNPDFFFEIIAASNYPETGPLVVELLDGRGIDGLIAYLRYLAKSSSKTDGSILPLSFGKGIEMESVITVVDDAGGQERHSGKFDFPNPTLGQILDLSDLPNRHCGYAEIADFVERNRNRWRRTDKSLAAAQHMGIPLYTLCHGTD